MVTVHAFPGVESHPDQLPNVEPLLGVAVSVTVVPSTKCAVHVPVDGPQSMPTGTLVTTPLPLPAGMTVNVGKLTDPTKGGLRGYPGMARSLQAEGDNRRFAKTCRRGEPRRTDGSDASVARLPRHLINNVLRSGTVREMADGGVLNRFTSRA